MTRCHVCGSGAGANEGHCVDCGAASRKSQPAPSQQPIPLTREAVRTDLRSCPGCRKPIAPGFLFCGACGTPVQHSPVHFATLVSIKADGSEGGYHRLDRQEVLAGSASGGLGFADDPYLSPRHCRFSFVGGRLLLDDLGSLNGVFRKVRGEIDLTFGDQLRIGSQLLRLEPGQRQIRAEGQLPIAWGSPNPGYGALLQQILLGGAVGDVFPLLIGENRIGREEGVVTFPGDGFVSGRHATLTVGQPALRIRDLGSSNGTFLRIRGTVALQDGDFLLLGNQILRVDLGAPGRAALHGRG